MSKAFVSLGYNMASVDSMVATSISINDYEFADQLVDGENVNLSGWWTPTLPTKISGVFTVDISQIYEDCDLNSSDQLYLEIFTYCSGTKIQHQSESIAILGKDVFFKLDIPAEQIAGKLELFAVILIRFEYEFPRKMGSPMASNSRLLERSWKFQLSGSHTQANITVADFSFDPKIENAFWKIQIEDDLEFESWLEVQHSSVVKIVLNESYLEVFSLLEIQALLMTDLVLFSLENSLFDDERLSFLQGIGDAEGSWAQYVKQMFNLIFSAGQIGIREYWRDSQPEIRARVQHLMNSQLEMQ